MSLQLDCILGQRFLRQFVFGFLIFSYLSVENRQSGASLRFFLPASIILFSVNPHLHPLYHLGFSVAGGSSFAYLYLHKGEIFYAHLAFNSQFSFVVLGSSLLCSSTRLCICLFYLFMILCVICGFHVYAYLRDLCVAFLGNPFGLSLIQLQVSVDFVVLDPFSLMVSGKIYIYIYSFVTNPSFGNGC